MYGPRGSRTPSRRRCRRGERRCGGRKKTLLSPEQFVTELENNKPLRDKCSGKHVIWVVGDDPGQSQEWKAALAAAFPKNSHIMTIELPAPIPPGERLRSSRQMARMSAYGT